MKCVSWKQAKATSKRLRGEEICMSLVVELAILMWLPSTCLLVIVCIRKIMQCNLVLDVSSLISCLIGFLRCSIELEKFFVFEMFVYSFVPCYIHFLLKL